MIKSRKITGVTKVFFYVVMLSSLSCTDSDDSRTLRTVFEQNNIVAHRGAWKMNKLPQNSIASLKKAIELRCKGSEFDVWLTADDSLVINHDRRFNGLNIDESKYRDLIKFKLSNGEQLPTLREFFAVGQKDSTQVILFCELKTGYKDKLRLEEAVKRTFSLVKEMQIESRIVIASFDIGVLNEMKTYDNNISCHYLNGDIGVAKLKSYKIEAGYSFAFYASHPGFISDAKSNNVKLNVWTVNDSVELENCLNNKFDYITTDEPELLHRLTVKRK